MRLTSLYTVVELDAELLQRLHQGDERAAELLYCRYGRRLRAFARVHISLLLSARLDPEDIVQAVFLAFFQEAAQGKYQTSEKQDLWNLLSVMTLNHIRSIGEFHRAAKRDVRRTCGHSDSLLGEGLPGRSSLEASDLRLFLDDLLRQFPIPLRRTVELRLEGYEVAEIALLTGQSERTTERSLHSFRRSWLAKWERDSKG